MSVLEKAEQLIEDKPKKFFENATNYLEIISLTCEIIEKVSKKDKNVTSSEKRETAVVISKKITEKLSCLDIINDKIKEEILDFIDNHSNIYEEIDTMVDILNTAKGCCKKYKKSFKSRYL